MLCYTSSMLPPDDTIQEQAWLIARGVRALALLGDVECDEKTMRKCFNKLGGIAGVSAIPFVIQIPTANHAIAGYAAAEWVIDLLKWSYDQPVRNYHQIVGLLLGYSANEIEQHDTALFAGEPTNQPVSMLQILCNTGME